MWIKYGKCAPMNKIRTVLLFVALVLALASLAAVPALADPAPQTTPTPIVKPASPGGSELPDV